MSNQQSNLEEQFVQQVEPAPFKRHGIKYGLYIVVGAICLIIAALAVYWIKTHQLVITPDVLIYGKVKRDYVQKLEVSGGQAPYIWTIHSGSLPEGLQLTSSGEILGKTNAAGKYDIAVKVTDSSSLQKTGTKKFFIQIEPSTCVKVYGNGPIGLEFVPVDGMDLVWEIQGEGEEWTKASISCKDERWGNLEDLGKEGSLWVSTIDYFKNVLDAFPPLSSEYFTVYRSDSPDYCYESEIFFKIYVLPCSFPEEKMATAYYVPGIDTVVIPFNTTIGVLAHELGHQIGGLCDEYENSMNWPNFFCGNCIEAGSCPPNWWPKPAKCYEGCNYRASSWFRDDEEDIMFNPFVADHFGPVDKMILQKAIDNLLGELKK